MRRLLALLVLSISFMIGGSDEARAEKQWGVAPVGIADISTETVYTQIAGPQTEVCVGPRTLMEYMRSPPDPLPTARMFAVLEGDKVQAFLTQTGGSNLIPFTRVIYIIEALETYPDSVRAVLADKAGCLILTSGERTDDPSVSAAQTFPRWLVDRFLKSYDAPSAGPSNHTI